MTAIAEPRPRTRSEARPLPRPITERLSALRGRLRGLEATLGTAYAALAIGVFIHGTFLLDRLLDLPVPFRAVLLVLGAGAIGAVAWLHVVTPLSRARGDDELALIYERGEPSLNDALISAVQLARGPAGGSRVDSDAMIGQVIATAEARVATLDAGKVADGSDARRAGLLALVVVAITIFLFTTRKDDGSTWFQRMILLSDEPWPRAVKIDVTVDQKVVAKGDDVTVRARVVRGAPSRIVVVPEFATQGMGEPIAMVDARGEWHATLENVGEPFRFYVEGGDYRSPWVSIDVRPRPRIDAFEAWLVHPSYTRLPATPEAEALKDLNVKVPGGTLVRWRAKASTPLETAELIFATPQSVQDVEAAKLSPDGLSFEGRFRVKDSTAATVRIVSKEGFETPVAAQYQVRAIVDRLPEVRIPKPGRNKDVTKAAAIALRVEVKDDYEPRAAALVYQVLSAKRPKEPGPEVRIPLPGLPSAEAGVKAVTIDWTFDLGQVTGGVETGDRIKYWVEAVDERAGEKGDTTSVPLESRGKSDKYELHAISEDDLVRLEQQALKRVQEDLTALAKVEKATATDMESLSRELASRTTRDPKDRSRLSYADVDHRKATQRLDNARQAFTDVKEEMVANKIGKDEDLRWVGDLEAGAERLVKDQAARASNDLAKLRQDDKPEAAKVLEVARTQKELVEGIEEIVKRLQKWDEFNEVLRDFRDLLNTQERIFKDTQERAKQDMNK